MLPWWDGTDSHGQITVDSRKGVVILPINGFAVPMHINTLKNVIKQEEGDFTVLRFMFVTPGAITGKKEDTVSNPHLSCR
jgi:nucleosome binding factor SPN SPT16 subunit